MTQTMALVILPLLVAMATAAPLAEQSGTGEQVVNINGDSKVVDRAKRAQEEIVFGNQQNGARLGAAKKSLPLFLSEQDVRQSSPLFASQSDSQDKSGYMFAARQQPVPPNLETQKEEEEKEGGEQGVPVAVEGGSSQGEGEGVQQPQQPVEAVAAESKQVPVIPVVEEGGETAPENVNEAPAGNEPEAEEASGSGNNDNNNVLEAVQAPEAPEVLTPLGSNPPLNSESADAEEALQVQETGQNPANTEDTPDDVESFLQELHENNDAAESSDKGEEDEEGSAEAELMQVANENSKNGEGEDLDTDSSEYTQNLLKYILLHGDEYGRAPVNYGYQYPRSYYLQRRRRSLASRRLHRLHRRHSNNHGSNKQLARSKRTKRDLFDDDLYYTRQASDDEVPDEERQADMEELIAYLMALYPALYENQQPPRQDSGYPGYFWYGNSAGNAYPGEQEPYPEYLEWEEPEYLEVPAGWEPSPVEEAPAWEPAFYPEEVEEPGYYPAPAKRQMLSMVPGNRRKRYFYPFAREPYTHWGAFVPSQEKRDYDDAYWRLKQLAMVLADSRQPSSPYLDAFDDYKKK